VTISGTAAVTLVQAARVDADFAARLVRLNARAVELPLESRASQALDGVGDASAGLASIGCTG